MSKKLKKAQKKFAKAEKKADKAYDRVLAAQEEELASLPALSENKKKASLIDEILDKMGGPGDAPLKDSLAGVEKDFHDQCLILVGVVKVEVLNEIGDVLSIQSGPHTSAILKPGDLVWVVRNTPLLESPSPASTQSPLKEELLAAEPVQIPVVCTP